ncbi:ATP-binding cassette domain-containing protein, partial [Alphaproteobacteria bacterium]|nr:ATP-binding cassette domain-containing protein [Alphaproteobacteria bacterium]
AMAIANNPDILIADEPTTALDVTIQKQILELLDELRKKIGMSLLIISHDLNVVKKISHFVCVMKKGKIVEQGTTKKIFENPSHSYTKSLINCVPKNKTNLDYKNSEVILEAKDINVDYKLKSNFFFDKKSKFSAVKKISFSVRKGETLGIVGESGSGKSSLAHAILNLIDFNGELYFKKQKISNINEASFRSLRKNIQIIFQDPFASLSPRMNIYDIIGEGLTVHKIGSKKNRNKLIHEIINEVGLDLDMLNRYPHEFSGGQRQRIAIARALILKPDLIILDEPTSALDMTVQSQIIDLLLKLQKKEKLTYIFISHDLKVIKALSDNILVMKDGNEIEYGNKKTIFEKPRNTYTKNLIKSAFL